MELVVSFTESMGCSVRVDGAVMETDWEDVAETRGTSRRQRERGS